MRNSEFSIWRASPGEDARDVNDIRITMVSIDLFSRYILGQRGYSTRSAASYLRW